MPPAQVQHPTDQPKDAVARHLAEAHFHVDPAIESIYRIVAPNREVLQDEPIKLLEVSAETPASGIVPVSFGPHYPSGISFPSVIVEVTPEEFVRIWHNELALPHGWQIGPEYLRPTGT